MNLIVDDGVEEVSFVKVWFNVQLNSLVQIYIVFLCLGMSFPKKVVWAS